MKLKIGPEGDKMCAQKFHSEAETANRGSKTAGVAVHVMKTMLQAAKSGYCTSVASEMSAQKGQKGIKCCAQNSTLRPKLHFNATKRAGVHVTSMKTMLQAAKSHTGCTKLGTFPP